MDTPRIELSVIIPVLNEEEAIVGTLDELVQWFQEKMPEASYEVLVIDDGSTDGTAGIVNDYRKKHPQVRLYEHGHNRGRGRAVRSGFEQSRGDFIVTLDADLSYGPDHIPLLVEPLREGRADITLASAYHPDGVVKNVPFRRELVSRLGNWLLRLGTFGELHTVTCLVRGYTRAVAQTLQLVNDGKDFHLEVIQKAPLFGFLMEEVPATLHWRDRKRKARTTGKKKSLSLLPRKGSTVISHLAYSFLLRPALLIMVPVVIFFSTFAFGCALLLWLIVKRIVMSTEPDIWLIIYDAVRGTLVDGALTLAIMLFSGVMLILFMIFAAMTAQNKKTYEEMIALFSRLERRVDAIQKGNSD